MNEQTISAEAASSERPGYSGGRVEPVEGLPEVTVDVNSSYPAKASGAAEPAAAASDAAASEEEATLPVVPEGAISTEPVPAAETSAETATEDLGAEEETAGTEESVQLRFIGEGGPEVDFLSPEPEELSFEAVILALVDAALEAERGGPALGGQQVAQIFCRGDVEDPRVAFLLLLLAQDKPVDGSLVLAAARATEGLEDLVERAVVEREELARVGDVSVEQLSAGGTFTPLESGHRSQVTGHSPDSGSGVWPQAASREPQDASEVGA